MTLNAVVVGDNTRDLNDTNDTKEEVDSCEPSSLLARALHVATSSISIFSMCWTVKDELVGVFGTGGLEYEGLMEYIQDVLWLDDQAPASPDQTSGSKSDVLGQGELFSRTVKVVDSSNDNPPLFRDDVSTSLLIKTPNAQASTSFVERFSKAP